MSSLTNTHLDALQELLNLGVGRAAGMLNRMLNLHVNLHIPVIKISHGIAVREDLEQHLGIDRVATVRLGFEGSCNGIAHLVFPPTSAAKLVAAIAGENTDTPDDLDSVTAGALSEVGNIVLNGVMGEISNMLHQQLKYSIPFYAEVPVNCLVNSDDLNEQKPFILAEARFLIEQILVIGDIILIFNISSFQALLLAIDDILEVDCEELSSH